MGNFLCIPRYGCCIKHQNSDKCKENHAHTPQIKSHRRNISATFNFTTLESDKNQSGVANLSLESDLININQATEEELMTVPGINRATAHNIVEYRQQLQPSGFKMLEDLALVSGVGASKLNQIRSELTIGTRKKTSQNNSANSSRVDLIVLNSSNKSLNKGSNTQVNNCKTVLNTSNVFQLMKVDGLNQTLAENIVAYRDKKGLFKTFDELLKVKGIKPPILSAVRTQLLLNSDDETNSLLGLSVSNAMSALSSGGLVTPSDSSQSSSLCEKEILCISQENLATNYGPLARRSFRNKKRPPVERRVKAKSLRFASWHLEKCSQSKTDNPGVKEVIAMTILENGLDVIMAQDIMDSEALQKLCSELNEPTIPNVSKWEGYRGDWKCVTSPETNGNKAVTRLGCIYDSSQKLEVTRTVHLTESQTGGVTAVAFQFKHGEHSLVMINVHCEVNEPVDPSACTTLTDLMKTSRAKFTDSEIFICGHFNVSCSSEVFAGWREAGYYSVIKDDVFTDITSDQTDGTCQRGSIWLPKSTVTDHQVECGVIRDGLANPWIPEGWRWGGLATHNCPIWAEVPQL